MKGRFVFSTTEVLQIAKEAEEETAAKKDRKRPRKRPISVEIVEDRENVPENVSSESQSDCIIVAKKRST